MRRKDRKVTQTAEKTQIRNGIDVDQLFGTLDLIKEQPTLARFTWRARNRWLGGAHNRTAIQSFYGAGGDDTTREQPFELDAGEPPVLLGTNEGANPAEALLHALAACLTTSLVYIASARGVELDEVESTLEGDMDVRGALGIDEAVHNGYQNIRVSFRIKSDAPREKLEEIVERAYGRSAVFDSLTRGVPVDVSLA